MSEGVKIALITGGFGLAAIFARWVVSVLPKSGERDSEVAQMRAELRVLSDYVLSLRRTMSENGITPPEWPEELTTR